MPATGNEVGSNSTSLLMQPAATRPYRVRVPSCGRLRFVEAFDRLPQTEKLAMDYRNRLGIYGAYVCGAAGIGFTLPFLPLYLAQSGLSDLAIGWISTCAALAGL